MKKIILIGWLLAIYNIATAQGNTVPNTLGNKFLLASKHLSENKEIQIYLPESYQKSTKKYPVLYVIDGQWYFPLSVGVQHMLSIANNWKVPEFIIVGIINKASPRVRYQGLVNNKKTYTAFLKQELIPAIEKRYRVTSERMAFGWQYGGSLVLRALIEDDVFSAVFSSDPYPLVPKFSSHLKTLYEQLPQLNSKSRFMYFNAGGINGTVKEGGEYLAAMLNKQSPKGLRWEYQNKPAEEHRSTPFDALYWGLLKYYHNYQVYNISSFDQYKSRGGVAHIRTYYKGRSKRFGFKNEVNSWTIFSLLRGAVRANNYDQFQLLMQDFKSDQVITKLRLSRALVLVDFYLKHQKPNEALPLLEPLYTNKKNQTSARLHHTLGKTWLALKNKTKARQYYSKAVDLAKQQKHRNLAKYEADLAKVN